MTDTSILDGAASGAQGFFDSLTNNSVARDIGNFAEGFVGKKPLFSGGQQIGNWTLGGGYFDLTKRDNLAPLCSGQVTLFPGVTAAQADPTTWTTLDDWGGSILASDYCAQAGLSLGGATVGAGGTDWTPIAIAGGLIALSLILVMRR